MGPPESEAGEAQAAGAAAGWTGAAGGEAGMVGTAVAAVAAKEGAKGPVHLKTWQVSGHICSLIASKIQSSLNKEKKNLTETKVFSEIGS